MPVQEKDRGAKGASPQAPNAAHAQNIEAPDGSSGLARRIRASIAQALSKPIQGAQSNQDQKAAPELTREQLTAHAVSTVQRWSEQLQSINPATREYHDLKARRDLVTKSLVAADVYADGAKATPSLPPHVVRLEGEAVKLFLGSDFDVSKLKGQLSGYYAALYFDKSSNTFLLANRGTGDIADWANNAQQAFGLPAQQYKQAVELARSVESASKKQYGTTVGLEFIGHSLGGSLASAQAIALPDCRAVTFNAAGLHKLTAERLNAKLTESSATLITAYQVKGEVLTTVQCKLSDVFKGVVVPEAAGRSVEMQPEKDLPRLRPGVAVVQSFERHLMDKVLLEVLRATGGAPNQGLIEQVRR
jgi:hypothetical protein